MSICQLSTFQPYTTHPDNTVTLQQFKCLHEWYSYLCIPTDYTVSPDFTEGDGYMRSSNSSCESPSGKVAVRLALTIVCFVLSSFIQGFGAGILGASFRAVQFFAPDG